MTEPETERERPGALLPVIIGVVIVVGGLVFLFTYDARKNRFTNVPESSYEARTISSFTGSVDGQELSPDGSSLAFVAEGETENVLRVGSVGVDATVPLAGSSGIQGPLDWSDDGQSLTFVRASGGETRIVEIPFRGGPESLIVTVDGEVLDLDRASGSIWIVRSLRNGSNTLSVVRLGNRELETSSVSDGAGIRWIAVAPDESRVAFSRGSAEAADLFLLDVATGDERRLTADGKPIHGIAWAGEAIIYSVGAEPSAKLWMISPEGLKIAELRTPGAAVEPSASRDGSRVLYRRPGTQTLELLEM